MTKSVSSGHGRATRSSGPRRVAIPIADIWRAMERHHAAQERYGDAGAGLVSDLEQAGFAVERLSQLRRRGIGSHRALPILLHWFSATEFVPLKCDIAEVLGCSWAQPEGAQALIAEYWRLTRVDDRPTGRLVAAICTSLQRAADDSIVPDLCAIALDPSHGARRGMAIVGLGSAVDCREQALRVLLDLLKNEEVVLFSVLGLVCLDARQEAIREIAMLTRHPNPVVGQVARRTVQRWQAAGASSDSAPACS